MTREMNKDIDVQFLCKDCERYKLCEYYHRRKKNSYICKFFHINEQFEDMKNTNKEMIDAPQIEPCDDAISRQAMHIELEKWITYGEYKYSNATKYLYDRIDRLPPVTPKADDVLDKISAEVMDFEEELFHRPNTDYSDYAAVRHCVEIIDKYKAEADDPDIKDGNIERDGD